MRMMILVGVVLLGVGGFILVHGLSYPSEKSVFKMGEFEATMEQQRNVPAWAGGLVFAAGAVLVALGARRRGEGP
jgi:hypothetical protein